MNLRDYKLDYHCILLIKIIPCLCVVSQSTGENFFGIHFLTDFLKLSIELAFFNFWEQHPKSSDLNKLFYYCCDTQFLLEVA